MSDFDAVRARICAALEHPEEDWVAHAVRVIENHLRLAAKRKTYDVSTLGGRIRAARELAGMTQRQLAKRIAMPKSTIHLIEKNKLELPMRKVNGLCMSLGLKPPWLLNGEGPGAPTAQNAILRVERSPGELARAELKKKQAIARDLAKKLSRKSIKVDTE